jgi:hypothetical protein
MPAPPQSWEGGVPEDAILLSEAFALFCRAAIPKWQEIENAAEAALNDQSEITRRTALDVLDAATRDAELEFRKHLATGKPRALMRDPATGANVAVSRAEWTARQSFAGMGFSEDFVWSGDLIQPGPDAISGGALRPVYFLPHDFKEFIVGLEGEKPKPAVPETSQSKRGPKERYDWMAAEKIAIESLDYHGDFMPADPDWNRPGQLVNVLRDQYCSPLDQDPSNSQIYQRVRAMIERWRQSRTTS